MRFFSVVIISMLFLSGCAAHKTAVKKPSHSDMYVACFGGGVGGPYWAGPAKEVEITREGWVRWVSLQSKEILTSNGDCLIVERKLQPLSLQPTTPTDTKPSVVIIPSD